MPSETIGKTIGVAALVCVVCSVFVSTAAVYLKPLQDANKILDKNKNVLMAGGLYKKGQPADVINKIFQDEIETKWVDLKTGEFVPGEFVPEKQDADIASLYADEKKALRNNELSVKIPRKDDIAGIRRKADYVKIYLTKKDGRIHRLILPVYGQGLWSTMYGFLALGPDLDTIESFGFYQQEETPGLGGEVDNPKWKKSWDGKKAFNKQWQPAITVVKGQAKKGDPYEVDGLSGATLTARGVDHLVRFWLGDEGFGPMLQKMREGGNHG